MFCRQVSTIICIWHFLISKVAQETIRPVRVKVTTDEIPVFGKTAITLATCRASSFQSAAHVKWQLGTSFNSVEKIKIDEEPEEMYIITNNLTGVPTVQMNRQNVKCVVRHPSLKEELAIDHELVVHYPPQLVFVTPFKSLESDGFQCEADANPAATHFSWKRMNHTIPSDAIKVEGNKLYFLKARSDLTGVYICEASNEYGTGIGTLYWQMQKGFHSEL